MKHLEWLHLIIRNSFMMKLKMKNQNLLVKKLNSKGNNHKKKQRIGNKWKAVMSRNSMITKVEIKRIKAVRIETDNNRNQKKNLQKKKQIIIKKKNRIPMQLHKAVMLEIKEWLCLIKEWINLIKDQ